MGSHSTDPETELTIDSVEFNDYCSTLEILNNGSGAQQFFHRLAYLKDRQLFKTQTGRLGFTLPDVEVGDLVCVLNGSWTPHAIRRANNGNRSMYTFIGDAYVHGLMYGEVDEMDLEAENLVFV